MHLGFDVTVLGCCFNTFTEVVVCVSIDEKPLHGSVRYHGDQLIDSPNNDNNIHVSKNKVRYHSMPILATRETFLLPPGGDCSRVG